MKNNLIIDKTASPWRLSAVKGWLIVFVAVMATALGASAQMPGTDGAEQPVRWRVSARMTSPTEGVLTLRPITADGWHIYGTEETPGGPVPTSFVFENCPGVAFQGGIVPSASPVRAKTDLFDGEVTYWEGAVTFTRRFTVTDAAKARIAGSIRYMGCNDASCMPPQTHKFSISVPRYKPKTESKK